MAIALLEEEDNPKVAVVGTTREDVVFEIIDNDFADPVSEPSYAAASKQSIRFRFTLDKTVIQPDGRLWFTIPVGWTSAAIPLIERVRLRWLSSPQTTKTKKCWSPRCQPQVRRPVRTGFSQHRGVEFSLLLERKGCSQKMIPS